MARTDSGLSAEELEAQDVAQLPNREAMSVISGMAPLPITDSDVPPMPSDDPTTPPGSTTDPPPPSATTSPSLTEKGDDIGRMPPGTDGSSEETSYIGPPVSADGTPTT